LWYSIFYSFGVRDVVTKQRKAMMEKEFNIYISNENIQNVNIQKL
jgi:hypothetical protein